LAFSIFLIKIPRALQDSNQLNYIS